MYYRITNPDTIQFSGIGDISSTLSTNGPILLTLVLGVGLAWWGMHRANKKIRRARYRRAHA